MGVTVYKDVLIWARKEAGLDEKRAASKLTVSERYLHDIEHSAEPTVTIPITLFDKMVTQYKRAPSVMLIPFVPPSSPLPVDYRTKGGKTPTISPDVRFAIREARNLQQEISGLLNDAPDLFSKTSFRQAKLQDDIERLAANVRDQLNVSIPEQLHWRRDDIVKVWRARLQALGILVLEKKMPTGDCSGFSLLGDDLIPTIVYSPNDGPESSSFTIFHELGHVLLRKEGICVGINRDIPIEKWCNDFSGALLVPEDALYLIGNYQPGKQKDWDLREIRELAQKLRVSRQVIALRLMHFNAAKPDLYDRVVKDKIPWTPSKGGFALPHSKVFAEVGAMSASVVLGALRKGIIDNTRAGQILDLNGRWFRQLGADLNQYQYKYSAKKT